MFAKMQKLSYLYRAGPYLTPDSRSVYNWELCERRLDFFARI